MEKNFFYSLKEKVEPQHTALIIVDMQNDFCSAQGAMAKVRDVSAAGAIIPKLKEFIAQARSAGVKPFFIYMCRGAEDAQGPYEEMAHRRGRKLRLCEPDSWGVKIVDELSPVKGDEMVRKRAYSAFIRTDLDRRLRDAGIKTLIMSGVATNVCVESTARDGFMLDYYIVYARDLMAAYDEKLHDNTLRNIKEHFGEVVTSEDILAIWGIKSEPERLTSS